MVIWAGCLQPLKPFGSNSGIRGPDLYAGGEVGSPPISRVLSWAAIPLDLPLPTGSSSLPGSDASSVIAPLFGLAPDGGYRAVRVTTSAVGSYPTGSPLPDPLAGPSAVCFLLPCSSPWTTHRNEQLYSARPLAGILLCGARTFLDT